MKLWHWLVWGLAALAGLPLLVVGGSVLVLGLSSLETRALDVQRSAAQGVATAANLWIGEIQSRLLLSGQIIDFESYSAEGRSAALHLIFEQLETVDIVGLVDPNGVPQVPFVFREKQMDGEGRFPVNAAELRLFQAHLPKSGLGSQGTVSGAIYRVTRKHQLALPIAVPVRGGSGLVLVAEVILAPLQRVVNSVPRHSVGEAFLVDSGGRILAHSDGNQLGMIRSRVSDYLSMGGSGRVRDASGTALLGAAVPLRTIAWDSVVERPRREALREARDLLWQIAIVLVASLGLAILIGGFLARRIGDSLQHLVDGARLLAGGQLEVHVPPSGPREIQGLARAFNVMAGALKVSSDEIEDLNASLQERVDEQTRQLRDAQAELLQSRKLAALGELGAGVAHELNNPLTGILGMAQLMLGKRDKDDPERRFLERIELDAKRCRDVTMNLLRFSEQDHSEEFSPVDMRVVVQAACGLRRELLKERGARLVVTLPDEPLELRGQRGRLQELVMALLGNAVQALEGEGAISLVLASSGAFAELVVKDDGIGIPPENLERVFEPFFTSKSDWRSPGLGLSVSHQTVQAHHGTIVIESEPGAWTRVSVRLPLGTQRDGPAEPPAAKL